MASFLDLVPSTTLGITYLSYLETKSTVATFPKATRLRSLWLRIPTDADVSSSEQALARVRQDLVSRRTDLLRRESSQNLSEGGWLSKVVVNFRGSSGGFSSSVTWQKLTSTRILGIGSGNTGSGSPGIPDVKEFGGVTTTTGQRKIRHYPKRQSVCHHRPWVRRILRIPNCQRQCKRT